jgi:hypothetical protein
VPCLAQGTFSSAFRFLSKRGLNGEYKGEAERGFGMGQFGVWFSLLVRTDGLFGGDEG